MRNSKLKHLPGIQATVLLLLLFFAFGLDMGAQLVSRDVTVTGPYPTGSSCVSCTGDITCQDTIRLPNIIPGGSDFIFEISQASGIATGVVTDVSITIQSGTCTHSSIVITPDQGTTPISPTRTITFPGTPDPLIVGCDIIFEVKFTYDNPPDPPEEDCMVFKVRYESLEDPVKLAFVLDVSGSMSLPVYSTGMSPPSRLDVLKNAVYAFLQKLEVYDKAEANDMVGLTYFSTAVIDASDANLTNGTVPATNSYVPVFADLNPQTHQQLTAMGLGLLKGKEIVGDNGDNDFKKIVILITDGLQNVNPLAVTSVYDIPSDLWATDIGADRLNDNVSLSTADSVFYFCIAMDITGGAVPALLSELAEHNGGNSFSTSTSDLSDFTLGGLLTQFLDDIYDNSPQTVSVYNSKLEHGMKSLSFDINDKVTNILFELNYDFGDSIDIVSIYKDGNETNLKPSFDLKTTPGGNYKIYHLDFPFTEGETEFSPQGQWTVKVNGYEDKQFTLTCIVDDHDFDYTCSAGKQFYTVGDTIKFNGKLFLNDEVIKNPDNKIKLILLKPGDDLGHLLATFETPDLQPDSVGDQSQVAMKLYELLKDEAFVNALAESDQIFDLTQDENGLFTGQFSDTKLSGTYQAIFLIEGEDKMYGKFIRTVKRSVFMRFGMLDPDETEFDVDVSQGDNGQTFVITVKPKNKFGYYLGPGYSNFLKLNLDSLKGIASDVKDNLDGSYTYTVTNVPDNLSPKDVCFTIFGEVIGCEEDCYPVTIWYYIILLIILLIVILIRKIKAKWFIILMWLIFIVWIVYIVLRYLKIICYEFL